MTPEKLAKSGREDGEQIAFMCWIAWNVALCPDLAYLLHIPNGGARGIVEASRFKAMGVRPGVPDLFLPSPQFCDERWFAGLWIEMKKPKGGKKNNPDQLRWAAWLKSQGYMHELCLTWQNAVAVVKHYYSTKNITWRDNL